MTERGRTSIERSSQHFRVGPSSVQWNGQAFEFHLDELGFPIPRRVRGTVTVRPQSFTDFQTHLDGLGRHRWGPIAPCSHVEVDFPLQNLRWQGHGYFDSNSGDEPIHIPFRRWDWSRASLRDGRTAVIYDVQPKQGSDRVIARCFSPDGSSQAFEPEARLPLPRTAWGIQRSTRGDAGVGAQVLQTLEDTPFYVRDMLSSQVLGEVTTSFHETLDCRRLAAWPIRMLLPFRMPRRA